MSDDAKRLFSEARKRAAASMQRLEKTMKDHEPITCEFGYLEVLRRKAAALDWLENHRCTVQPDEEEWLVCQYLDRGWTGPTLLEAIEAAMKAEKEDS